MAMVIDDYQAKGYVFVTLGQLFGLGRPVPYPSSAMGSSPHLVGEPVTRRWLGRQ
jgi:hypothetical protein